MVQPIHLDTYKENLKKGVGIVAGSDLPTLDMKRSVIAGHRGYDEDLMFLQLDDLQIGEKFTIHHLYQQRLE